MDANGNIAFAGVVYNVGRRWAGRLVEVFSRGGLFYVACEGVIVRSHPARHDADKEKVAMLDRRRGAAPASIRSAT